MNTLKWLKATIATLIAFMAVFFGLSAGAFAQTKADTVQGKGYIQLSDKEASKLVLQGTAPDLGQYSGEGEITFTPDNKTGGTIGQGVAVFKTESGDQIVANVNWLIAADGTGSIEFDWQNSVQLSDGTVVNSTGVYAKKKPKSGKSTTQTHLVVISIIAILIG